jgi:serine/threonine protein kinase/tetratricopeptide (TPR) repeat protein
MSIADYERLGPIGDSHVERARTKDGAVVALKRFDGAEGHAFEGSARKAASIVHPNLVRVIDYGVEEVPWIATELIEAMTLRDLFGARQLSPSAALVLLHPVAGALAVLHEAGVVHGDVRPDNVLVRATGDVVLVDLDFGLSKNRSSYLSPERLDGRDVDASADVWAFAATLYELIAGTRPFPRDDEEAIRKGRFTPLVELEPRIDTELDWLIGVCLARDPWARPRDGASLLARLRPFVPVAIDDLRAERVALLSDPAGYDRRQRKRHEPAPPFRTRKPPPVDLEDDEEPPRSRIRIVAIAIAALAVVGVLVALPFLRKERPPHRSPGPPRHVERVAPGILPLAREWLSNDLPPDVEGLLAHGAPLVTRSEARALIGTPDGELDRVVALFENRDPHAAHALSTLANARPDDVDVMLVSAYVAQRSERFEEAESLLSIVLQRVPDRVEARLRRGILYDRLGRMRDAYYDLRRVIEERPNDTRALAELAQIYSRAGHAHDAVPIVRRIVRLQPNSADAWLDLSVTLGDDDREALSAIEHALAIVPDHLAALRRRCTLLAHLGGFSAITACNVAIERLPEDGELYMARADAYARERRFSNALADADRAVELAPSEHLLYRRSLLRERAGDSGGALRDLSAACSQGHEEACDQLRRAGISP